MSIKEHLFYDQMTKTAVNFLISLLNHQDFAKLYINDEVNNQEELFNMIELLPDDDPVKANYRKLQCLSPNAKERIFTDAQHHLKKALDGISRSRYHIEELKRQLIELNNDDILLETDCDKLVSVYKKQLKDDFQELINEM